MSKKLLIMFLAIVTGALMASVAMASEFGEQANHVAVDPRLAGTILNPEGKGDVLIGPFFDVRKIGQKAQTNYIAIINEDFEDTLNDDFDSDDHGVAAKIRFREWDKSEEVFDVNIWLSPNDVWIGILTQDASGFTKITSPDYVITSFTPGYFVISKTSIMASPGIFFATDFVPGGAFSKIAPPAGIASKDLTNMGYWELIGEERTYSDPYPSGSQLRVNRFSDGTPGLDCPNSLSAYFYIVRTDDGVSLGYNATAIANFSRQNSSLFGGPGTLFPDLSNGQDGLDELEFQLSKAKVYHGYDINPDIASKFSMIVTFPTKHFHFAKQDPTRTNYNRLGDTQGFGGRPFSGDTANSGEVIDVVIFDREENPFTPEVGFTSPQTTPTISLPYEVNVIGLYPETVPASFPTTAQQRNNVGLPTGGFTEGWFWIDLYRDQNGLEKHVGVPMSWVDPAWTLFEFFGQLFTEYHGLPTLSIALQEFTNGNVGGAYGTMFPAFYQVDWVSSTEE